jgi:hypothetical protein
MDVPSGQTYSPPKSPTGAQEEREDYTFELDASNETRFAFGSRGTWQRPAILKEAGKSLLVCKHQLSLAMPAVVLND